MPIQGRGTDDDPIVSTPCLVMDVTAAEESGTREPVILLYLSQPHTDELWCGAFSLDEWRRLRRLGDEAMAAHEDGDRDDD